MFHGHRLACVALVSLLLGCSSESTSLESDINGVATVKQPSANIQNANQQNVNDHSAVKRLKARIILYTHADFNQSQVEALLLPIMPQDSVLYLRKLATQGHVLVIQAHDAHALQQKLQAIHSLNDVKLLEQDAVLTIKDQ